MKLNKKQMEALTLLPDDALRRIVISLGSSAGFDLSGLSVSSDDLNRLRSVLHQMDDSDINRAAEIIKNSGKSQQNLT